MINFLGQLVGVFLCSLQPKPSGRRSVSTTRHGAHHRSRRRMPALRLPAVGDVEIQRPRSTRSAVARSPFRAVRSPFRFRV